MFGRERAREIAVEAHASQRQPDDDDDDDEGIEELWGQALHGGLTHLTQQMQSRRAV